MNPEKVSNYSSNDFNDDCGGDEDDHREEEEQEGYIQPPLHHSTLPAVILVISPALSSPSLPPSPVG